MTDTHFILPPYSKETPYNDLLFQITTHRKAEEVHTKETVRPPKKEKKE